MIPTATELALINMFIIVLILLEGIIKIGSKKPDYVDPNRKVSPFSSSSIL